MTISSIGKAAASLTAQNTFTDWLELRGKAALSIAGVSDSTVTLQRSFDAGATINDVEDFTVSTEKVIDANNEGISYRVGIKAGGYGTDTVVCRISQ